MAIRNFFKAKPEPERERALRDPEQILAWLEELARIRTEVELRFTSTDLVPVAAKAELVGEETHSCSFSLRRTPPVEPSPKQKVELVFPLDGRRFRTELTYLGRGGYLEYRFQLPEAIHSAERRDTARVHMRSREKLHIVALQGLGEGYGLSGELVDLSLGGCGFLIQRVIRVKDERRLPPRADLLEPGTPLALVRLTDLPRLPLVECGGRVSHMRQWPGGVTLGLAFEHVGAFEQDVLSRFLAERIPGFVPAFPWKRRYKDLTEAERLAPQPPALPEPAEPEGCCDNDPAEAFSDTELEDLREAMREEDPLTKLRKRGKKILLVMADELGRTLLTAQFQQDGYRCLFEARSLIQALEWHRKVPVDLLVVDQTVGHHGALDVVEGLRAAGMAKAVPVVVLQRRPDVRLTVAGKAGGINLVVDHPVDFSTVLKAPLEGMLGLA